VSSIEGLYHYSSFLKEYLFPQICGIRNKTLLAKLGWNVHSNPNLHSQFLEALIKAGSSWLWNGIPKKKKKKRLKNELVRPSLG
jgi:hypothetical protein